MSRIAIFIDGGYLAQVLKRDFAQARIDFAKLSQFALHRTGAAALLRAYFYDCLPFQSSPPTSEESARYARHHGFLERLAQLPCFTVRQGRLARREVANRMVFQQKMVDTLLSIDLVTLFTKQRITDAVLVAGDADFVPALRVARDEGVKTWLIHGPAPVHNELYQTVDQRIVLTPDIIGSFGLET